MGWPLQLCCRAATDRRTRATAQAWALLLPFLCPPKILKTPHNRFDRSSVGLPRWCLCHRGVGEADRLARPPRPPAPGPCCCAMAWEYPSRSSAAAKPFMYRPLGPVYGRERSHNLSRPKINPSAQRSGLDQARSAAPKSLKRVVNRRAVRAGRFGITATAVSPTGKSVESVVRGLESFEGHKKGAGGRASRRAACVSHRAASPDADSRLSQDARSKRRALSSHSRCTPTCPGTRAGIPASRVGFEKPRAREWPG